LKAVKDKLPENQKDEFEKGAQPFAKKILSNLKDYEFVRLSILRF
jgi:hypothetical protein